MKKLATIDTADFTNCINTGYRYTLWADGHLAAEYHTCWQGSRDGARYVTSPGYVDVGSLGEGPDADAEAALTTALEDVHPAISPEWRQTRRGHIVR